MVSKRVGPPPAGEEARQALALIGRSEQVDVERGMSSNYSCQSCCSNGYYSSFVSPGSSDVEVDTLVDFDVYQQDKDCYGVVTPPYPKTPSSWSSSDTGTATVNSSGLATTVGAGETTIQASWTDYRYDLQFVPCSDFSPGAPQCYNCDAPVEVFPSPSAALQVKPTISGPTNVWWFNGANPGNANMPVSIQLTTQSSGSSYNWTANSTGDGSVTLQNATTNTVTVTGAAMSKPANDIKITVTVNGVTSDQYAITVKAPNQLVRTDIQHSANANFGYRTEITYTIRDQFNALLPGGNIQVNEGFTGSAVPDFTGMNWTITDEKVFTLSNPVFSDVIEGENLTKNPTPQAPQNPLGSTKVVHWGQDIYVGSTTVGSGKKVQTARFQKYRDHADHENVSSPVQ